MLTSAPLTKRYCAACTYAGIFIFIYYYQLLRRASVSCYSPRPPLPRVMLAVFSTLALSRLGDTDIAITTFDGTPATTQSGWKAVNDPVMGGRSVRHKYIPRRILGVVREPLWRGGIG